MSHTVYKSGFRVNIESLRGKSDDEALSYFRTILGEPEDVGIWDGKVNYFRYDGEYRPNSEYTYRTDGKKDDGWFVDYIIDHNDYGCELYLKLSDITEIVSMLTKKFSVSEKDVMIFAYSWYNGSDEPRFMQPIKKK